MAERPALHPPAPPRPISFRLLLDAPVPRMRREFRAIYPGLAVPVALFELLSLVLQVRTQFRTVDPADPFSVFGQWAQLLAALLPLAIAAGLAYSAMATACVDAVAGRPVSMAAAWRSVLRPRALGTLLLVATAVTASFLCCGLPALYVAPLLAFTLAAMADERRYGFAALARSAELARHNPSRRFGDSPMVKALGILLVGLLLSWALRWIVVLPLAVVQVVLTFRRLAAGGDPQQVARGFLVFQAPAQFLSSLATSVIGLYQGFAFAELFFDARRRREAPELREAILAMTAGAATSSASPAAAAAAAPLPAGTPA